MGGFSLPAQVFTGTNAPGTGQSFSLTVGAGVTNLAITLAGDASAYSHVYVRRTVAPTTTTYDFSSQDNGRTNGVYLEQPELQTGTYWVRVHTPAGSAAHGFTLRVETNAPGLRSAARPVSKLFAVESSGQAAPNAWEYFRVEVRSNLFWQVTVDSLAGLAPGVYVEAGQLPTRNSLKRCVETTNNLVAFATAETQPGPYYIGVLKSSGTGPTPYRLKVDRFEPQTLVWDPGTEHLGTEVLTNATGAAGDFYFRIVTANPSLGAWRTALRVAKPGEANLYLGRGVLPGPNTNARVFASERPGSDGMVMALSSHFLPNEEWFILVRAKTGAHWTLVSGTPYVQPLGTVAEDGSSGSGEVEIGPEGFRYFRTTTPVGIAAWALYLNGQPNSIFLKSNSLPVAISSPKAGFPELSQAGQMLVVTPYLNASRQYFIGIPGEPHSLITLDSRVHPIEEWSFGTETRLQTTGFPYKTYRVAVPGDTIAWRLYLTSTNGNQNLAVRRNYVPNEQFNGAFSELPGTRADQITLVPPVLSDGAFYITVYGTNSVATNAFGFTLQNGPPEITEIAYAGVTVNDQPERVGWRFYRVSSQPPTALGWDLQLSNAVPGTRMALRRGNVPSSWSARPPAPGTLFNYFDIPSTAEFNKPRDFLQLPDQQAGIWYVGIYHPSNALGAFTLIARALEATPLAEGLPVVRTNMPAGRWDFFSFTITPEDLQGPAPALGWDLRLLDVWAGTPQLVVRRDGLPTNITTTSVNKSATNWLTGQQWAADKDWTQRSFSPDGATNEDKRVLAMAAGRPLAPGTYYIGVLNTASTNEGAYSLQSRWIGVDRSIPVVDLPDWAASKTTNTVNPREAAYYRVVLPNTAPSWRVKLTTMGGEAMLAVRTNWIPSVDVEQKMQKAGNEHYLRLPAPKAAFLSPGTNYLAVIGEGQNPTDKNRIGAGPTTFTLEMLGTLPVQPLGVLGTQDIVTSGSVEGGTSAAYRFETPEGLLGFWVMLEDTTGNPVMVYRGGSQLSDPGLKGDPYGNEGGETDGVASGYLITVGLGGGTMGASHNIVVKARGVGAEYPDAAYTLRIRPIIPEDVSFDGGIVPVTSVDDGLDRYYRITVPGDALGWDLRLTNIVSGFPLTWISRDSLPIGNPPSFSPNQYGAVAWPSGAIWKSDFDWTRRPNSASGESELGRVAAMGMGRPLQPGTYYVMVDGFAGTDCQLQSRGIGEGYSIGVTNLAFAGGDAVVQDLAPREAAYFRVEIPESATNWKLRLEGVEDGECLLVALRGAIPNVGAAQEFNVRNSAGRKMQKVGREEFLLLPEAGQDVLGAGVYYLAVVSEGRGATNATRVGATPVSFTLKSFGQENPVQLGSVSGNDLVVTNTLFGGETRLYQFQVPAATETVVVTLEDRVGNPVMTLLPGSRVPNPGASGVQISADSYGSDGGSVPFGVNSSLITLANPTNGTYTVAVKARATANWTVNQVIADASYVLRVSANSTIPLAFDGGLASIEGQAPRTWRYFKVIVPTNAEGWDVRLTSVTGGLPRMVVRRESPPAAVTTTSGWQPATATAWPTNHHWAADKDWTRRSLSASGTNEDGRILAMGMGRPLEPGLYYVGVSNASPTVATTYALQSRGIGAGFVIPVVDLPFGEGVATNLALPAREAAYYRVVVPSNAPSWKLAVNGLTDVGGEFMLAALRGAIPSVVSVSGTTLANGRAMQQPGNEHFALLPATGFTSIPPGTNYLAVVSEGLNPVGNPGTSGRVGLGDSGFVIASLGVLEPTDLGFLFGQEVLEHPDTLQCGEVKAYRFTVLPGTPAVKVTLGNRSGNPVVVALSGERLPNPGAAVPGASADAYGYEGGYTSSEGSPTILTIPEPRPGVYSLSVKARPVAVSGGSNYPDAAYTLRVQTISIPDLNFAAEQNTNGLSHAVAGTLEDNERNYYRFTIPAPNADGPGLLGWQLTLRKSNQAAQALLRVRPGRLPSDGNTAAQTPFSEHQLIVVPPFLTNGVWYVEVKGSSSTSFTLESSPLQLQRTPWVMPAKDEPGATPGLEPPMFGDSGVAPDGTPLANPEIELEQGYTHLYAVEVPTNNTAVLRTLLLHSSGSPNLYLRVNGAPTVSHNSSGANGTIFERSMLAAAGTSHDYGHWVPLDGKAETELKAGTWYLAVRAAGTSNARYRLQLFQARVHELELGGAGLRDLVLEHAGDWVYGRVRVPTALPVELKVTFERTLGDLVMHMRDAMPPGSGTDNLQAQVRDWTSDKKNNWSYGNYANPGVYTFAAGPLRPGQDLYFGFRARKRSQFSVRVENAAAGAQEPMVVPFYGGEGSAVVAAHSAVRFRVDVPGDARRWKHTSTHPTNLVVWLDQGTIPTATANIWKSSGVNSAQNKPLAVWNDALKQFETAAWPWVPGQSYFFVVTNTTAEPREFALRMDGRNDANDDNDGNRLLDAWELFYFGKLGQNPLADPDGDGLSNEEESLAGTNPFSAQSSAVRLWTFASNGSISTSPAGTVFDLGSSVRLTAVPNPGYVFSVWGGDVAGTANPLTLTMNAEKTVLATFKRAGDDFEAAIPLAGASTTASATNLACTRQTGEPNHAGLAVSKSVWFAWSAPMSGKVSLSTAGSNFRTVLAVYSGPTLAGLQPVVSAVDNSTSRAGCEVIFEAMAGQLYYFAVDGKDGGEGRVALSLSTAESSLRPRISHFQSMADGSTELGISAEANRECVIEFSEDLRVWDELLSVPTSGGTIFINDLSASDATMRFYRVYLR